MNEEVYQLQRIAGLLTEDDTVPPVTARDIIKSPDFVEIGPDEGNGSGEYFLIGTVAGRCYTVGCSLVNFGDYGNFEEIRQMKAGLTVKKLLNLAHQQGLIYCDRSPRPPRHLLCIYYNYEKFDEFLEEQTYGSFTAYDVDDLDEDEDIDLSDTPQFNKRPQTVEGFIRDDRFIDWLTAELKGWRGMGEWGWGGVEWTGVLMGRFMKWAVSHGYDGRRNLRPFVKEYLQDRFKEGLLSIGALDRIYDLYIDETGLA